MNMSVTNSYKHMSVVYDCRNVQQQSPDTSQPPAHNYVNFTPNQTGQDEEPPYESIGLQLGQTQHGPGAGQYDSLNPQTQGEQPQYNVISRPQEDKDAADYVNIRPADSYA